MQALSVETLQGLLKNLYLNDSSVDAALLSSQLLQILSGASANDDSAVATDLWTGADAVLGLEFGRAARRQGFTTGRARSAPGQRGFDGAR